MKIAQVSPFFYPHVGGVESHVLTLSERLVKNDHEVTVYTSNHGNLKEKEKYCGINIVRAKMFKEWFYTPITPKLEGILSQDNHDVVHAHTPPPLSAYYAAKACRKSKTPFIITYHCDLELPGLIGKILTPIYRSTLERYTVRSAKKIIAHTKSYSATSRTIWKHDINVIPSAVDLKRFKAGVDISQIKKKYGLEGKNVVLFVGRLVYHKGLDHLIEAMRYVSKDTLCLIVGEGTYREKLRKKAIDNGVKDRIIFVGRVSYRDLPKYFEICDIFALPSISRLEAFGLVVVEAMASGKPVVISNIPGVMELVTDGVEGLLTEPMNPKDLAEKVNTLLSNEEMRRVMGRNARKRVEEQFNWENVIEQIEKVYSDVV